MISRNVASNFLQLFVQSSSLPLAQLRVSFWLLDK